MSDEYGKIVKNSQTLTYIRQDFKEEKIIKSAEALMSKEQRHVYNRLRMNGLSKMQAIRRIAAEDHN